MKKFVIVLTAAAFVSCKSADQKLRDQASVILKKVVIQDSLMAKVDSIKIYRIDTLTDLTLSQRRIINLSNKSDFYLRMAQSYITQSKLEQDKASLSLSQEKLYASLDSKVLTDNARDDVYRAADEMKKLALNAQTYGDSVTLCSNQINDLQNKIRLHKINSKNFKGYSILYKALGADKKNMEVKNDSLITFLSPNFRIMPITKI